jgi:UDP:flavonoid glycosyltransferase YjiC (YdhE family)
MKVACFVTGHGMGHATRLCALLQALEALAPEASYEIFTSVPAWVFTHSLQAPFRLHPLRVDIGLAQRTPFEEDLPETLRQLAGLLPYADDLVAQAARAVQEAGCKFVLCDIAPLGILVAERVGIPSVLVENFRWDWIYAGYLDCYPQIQRYIDYLGELFTRATIHLQTEPLCDPSPRAARVVPPISRAVRTPAQAIRRQIGASPGKKVVLVTSGAAADPTIFAARARKFPDLFFVFPDDVPDLQHTPNGVRLPRRFYHPDLVNASDAVVGKAGYSTLAEAYSAGALFAYVGRSRFRESAVLGEFIRKEMGGFEIPGEWQALAWLPELDRRLAGHVRTERGENGAWQAARLILTACGLG